MASWPVLLSSEASQPWRTRPGLARIPMWLVQFLSESEVESTNELQDCSSVAMLRGVAGSCATPPDRVRLHRIVCDPPDHVRSAGSRAIRRITCDSAGSRVTPRNLEFPQEARSFPGQALCPIWTPGKDDSITQKRDCGQRSLTFAWPGSRQRYLENIDLCRKLRKSAGLTQSRSGC